MFVILGAISCASRAHSKYPSRSQAWYHWCQSKIDRGPIKFWLKFHSPATLATALDATLESEILTDFGLNPTTIRLIPTAI